MEELYPIFSFICIAGMIYGFVMACIWSCILVLSIKYGSPNMRYRVKPPPPVQSFEDFCKEKKNGL